MPEAFPHLLSVDKHGPHDRPAGARLIEAHTVARLADGLRPAPPGLPGHSLLRSWAMLWASAVGSYGGPGGAASFWRSPRRILWRPRRLARRSGMAPSRTARLIVSSQRPVSLAASHASRSASSHAWAT